MSAPQASFLTSGLPDVGDGSASSTPSQAQQETVKSPDEEKPIDPTVDNIEVADMDVDSDSEKSDTSEEASVEDPKGSNDQTPTSTESSDSQPVQTTQESEITPVISPAASVAPAQPLSAHMGSVMPVQTSLLPSQPQVVAPQPAVGMVIPSFMGVQGVRFPGLAPQFRPGVRPMQTLPGMPQNALLPPSGTLPGPGQITSQRQLFPQVPQPARLLSTSNAPIPGGMGTLQPFPLGNSFVNSQAPLPVAAATVPAPVQMTPDSVPIITTPQARGGLPQAVVNIGSPDSEASAPSPVGSPELHLEEGDETPETTPAPLGDVDVKDNTGFDTNKSFLENPVKNQTTSLGLGFSGTSSAAKAASECSSSSNSTPSTSDQFGGHQQDAALAKKDSGQNVSAVDILAQLLSRGRKLKETADPVAPSASLPITPPNTAPSTSNNNPGNSQGKPLLSLIDSLFPKLSDSIKTLKEREKAVNPPEAQGYPPSMPSSLPARPLPIEGQFQCPPAIVREQPPFQQEGLKSILKKGPRNDQDLPEFGSNHSGVQDLHHQGPVGDSTSFNVSEEMPKEKPLGLHPDDARPGHDQELRQLELQGIRPIANKDTTLPAPTNHLAGPDPLFQSPPIRGPLLRNVSQQRPFDRPMGDVTPWTTAIWN